jgi:hypothetical protein
MAIAASNHSTFPPVEAAGARGYTPGLGKPPVAGSIEEELETAAVVGFPGGLGGSINREE